MTSITFVYKPYSKGFPKIMKSNDFAQETTNEKAVSQLISPLLNSTVVNYCLLLLLSQHSLATVIFSTPLEIFSNQFYLGKKNKKYYTYWCTCEVYNCVDRMKKRTFFKENMTFEKAKESLKENLKLFQSKLWTCRKR